MANFTPKSVFKTKDSNGNVSTTEEWNYGDIGSETGIIGGGFIPILVVSLIFMVIASPLLFLISFFTFKGRMQFTNIIGVLIGSYFLIDCYHHWLFSSLFIFLDVDMIKLGIAVNVGALLGNLSSIIICVLFGEDSMNKETNKPNYYPILIIFSLFLIGYKIGNHYTPQIGESYIAFQNSLGIK